MPLTTKGKKIMKSMKKQYGKNEGEKVFYASRNKGTIKGVERASKGKLHEEDRIKSLILSL